MARLTRHNYAQMEDVFPLIEAKKLVKFRIHFLQVQRWTERRLLEYFTFVFTYGQDGSYGLDIWRAGTGVQQVSSTESDLRQLGEYLRKMPRLTSAAPPSTSEMRQLLTAAGAEPVEWTLAFHAVEQPVEPSIGIWKFGRGEFEGEQHGYEHTRISRLQFVGPRRNH